MKKIILSVLMFVSVVANASNDIVYVADDYNLTLWGTSNYTGKVKS